MKQLFLLFFCTLIFGLTANAQNNRVEEVKKGMSLGVNEAFVVDYQGLDNREAEKVLMAYLKEYKGKSTAKKDRKSKEILLDDASISALSSNSIDLYAVLDSKGEGGSVTFWFDLGGAFLSEENHKDKMEALSEWLYEFGKTTRARAIELEVEEEEKRLKDLNKDFDKLKREQEKLLKTIQNAQDAIAKAEKDLEDNASAQSNAQESIEAQQKTLENVKDKLKKVN